MDIWGARFAGEPIGPSLGSVFFDDRGFGCSSEPGRLIPEVR
jgi:hypothetical protein